jgi:TetR/AcrR family transcriptional regulator
MRKPIPTRAELMRERILEAAEVVFAKHGLNGTRVREIADAAGVNIATLYIYFPGKQDLYEAVLERGVRPLVELMTDFTARPRGIDEAARLLEAVMKHLASRPEFSRLVYLEAISQGGYLSEIARRWLRPLLETAVRELEAHTALPPWETDMTPLIVAAFVHLSIGHFALAPLLREVFDSDPTSEDWVGRQTRFIITLIRQMFDQSEAAAEARDEDVAQRLI